MSVKPESSVRSSNEISFAMQYQDQPMWCWAATASSVADYYDTSTVHPQCFLAEWAFNNSTCCENGGTNACNRPFSTDLALIHLGNYSISSPGAAAYAKVADEIDAQRPVVAVIVWTTNTGHAAAVTGYLEIPPTGNPAGFPFPIQYLRVQDSFYGTSYVLYDAFCSYYQSSGTWVYTFFTKR
ncbi:papain-like cysteine protease family protein [Streptomyces luteogriseus]|uniref:papain-like cysteine protease family protein n=1 Tax=Streptomyces luteogriseus TaxID=68233 RepID=UPI0037F2FA37